MSQRHDDILRAIRLEHDDVVAALKQAGGGTKRGAPGRPTYDPRRLEVAIASADDAYALLLIATAEAFLREYLASLGIAIGPEPKLSMLIDKSTKELNARSLGLAVLPEDRRKVHDLRVNRNTYAHGHSRAAFPSVPRVQDTLSRFLFPFP